MKNYRRRGTALVFKEGLVLLVRDRNATKYSLPGGGVEHNEPSIATACRELYEELGMSAKKAERIFRCDFKGSTNTHKVSLIETPDTPHLKGKELAEYLWWDMKSIIPILDHVTVIISRYFHKNE